MNEPALSIVVPIYNERESLAELHRQIAAVAHERNLNIEIVFVDDGSWDGSWEIVRQIAGADSRVRGICFRRNFGKAAALQAGLHDVRGQRVLTMDADLQDDPAEIPNFLAELEKGMDLVCGWKKIRFDPWHKVLPSRIFNGMVSWLTGVRLQDHNCGMKACTADLVRELRLYGEMHRFIPVFAAAKGFRIGEVVIRHRPRQHGRSKYGVNRFLRGFLDLLTVKFLTTHGRRPMHLFGGMALISLILLATIAILGLFWSRELSAMTTIGVVLAVLVPLILYLHGLQAELIVSTQMDEPYSIVDRVG
jgi:glycosyltransferase involved in cell wall biosynthesis